MKRQRRKQTIIQLELDADFLHKIRQGIIVGCRHDISLRYDGRLLKIRNNYKKP